MEPPPTPSVEVLSRAVRILEVLAEAPQGATLSQLSQETGIAKSSVHRLAANWERLGYVSRNGAKTYQLGLAALALARKVSKRNRVVDLSHGLLRQLQAETKESVYLGIYRRGHVVLVDAVESLHPLRVVVDLGERCYLHASAQGRAVAAWLDPLRLLELLREQGMPKLTAKTQAGSECLSRRLQEVRENGYVINWEETVEGSVCLAAPLFAGAEGPVLGSLGVSIPTPRANEDHIGRCLQALVRVASELAKTLGEITPEPEARARCSFLPARAVDDSVHQNLNR